MISTAILIPARYASTRLPGKPLKLLNGVPMIKRVYDAAKATGYDTYVLTDDMRIFSLFNANNCWIRKIPDQDLSKDYGERTWMFDCERIDMIAGV